MSWQIHLYSQLTTLEMSCFHLFGRLVARTEPITCSSKIKRFDLRKAENGHWSRPRWFFDRTSGHRFHVKFLLKFKAVLHWVKVWDISSINAFFFWVTSEIIIKMEGMIQDDKFLAGKDTYWEIDYSVILTIIIIND